MSRTILFSLALTTLAACSDKVAQEKIAALEERVAKLEAGKPAGAAGAAAPSPEDEAAMNLYREASQALAGGDAEGAKAKFGEIKAKYPNTKAAQAADRQLAELSVVGKDVGGMNATEWYQGSGSFTAGKANLLVFWEVWCPHCKREVPKLVETEAKFKAAGLNVVGLTSLSRGKTKEEVMQFAAENKVTYPLGKADEATWQFFGVGGVPAAAVVKDGKVVWRGHPAALKDEQIQGWLN